VIWRGLLDSSSVRGRTSGILLCGSWWSSKDGGGVLSGRGFVSKTKRSRSLGVDSGSSRRRRDDVDDVGRLAEAEIFVTDEAHGRRSRGGIGAFEETKGESMGF
jgi:hypothetical protein